MCKRCGECGNMASISAQVSVGALGPFAVLVETREFSEVETSDSHLCLGRKGLSYSRSGVVWCGSSC